MSLLTDIASNHHDNYGKPAGLTVIVWGFGGALKLGNVELIQTPDLFCDPL